MEGEEERVGRIGISLDERIYAKLLPLFKFPPKFVDKECHFI